MQDSRIRPATPTDGQPAHFRRVVSFHPRGGRLNQVQRKAFDTHAERWYLESADLGEPSDPAQASDSAQAFDSAQASDPAQAFDPAKVFGRTAPLVVEIGSGMGESTAAMAAARPDINLMAIEVYKPGVAQTFHHLARTGVENVRVVRGDAVEILTDRLADGSLTEVWLFFPDPWPKSRHHKRRLVTPEFAELVATKLADGGVFRLATDWEPYAEQMLAVCGQAKGLRNLHTGWAPRPEFRPRTRFERRGVAAGREIFDLEFTRR